MSEIKRYEPARFDVKGKVLTLQPGQVCVSERQMAEECGVGRQVVRTFLRRLQDENAITRELAHGLTQARTIVTICNYQKYQHRKERANPDPNPAPTQSQPTNKQENTSVPYGTDARGVADVRAQVYATGKAELARDGVKNPGSLITKWLREASEADVLAALLASDGRNDRVAFIEGSLRKRKQQEVSDAERLRAWGIHDLDAEDSKRNPPGGGDHRQAAPRQPANDLSGVLTYPAEERRSVPFRDVQAGRDCLELLALRH